MTKKLSRIQVWTIKWVETTGYAESTKTRTFPSRGEADDFASELLDAGVPSEIRTDKVKP